MITFASIDNPKDKRTAIPRQLDSRFKYIMYCNDEVVGTTYGVAVKRLVVKTPNFEHYQFDVDQLKKIQRRNMSKEQLLKFATKI